MLQNTTDWTCWQINCHTLIKDWSQHLHAFILSDHTSSRRPAKPLSVKYVLSKTSNMSLLLFRLICRLLNLTSMQKLRQSISQFWAIDVFRVPSDTKAIGRKFNSAVCRTANNRLTLVQIGGCTNFATSLSSRCLSTRFVVSRSISLMRPMTYKSVQTC